MEDARRTGTFESPHLVESSGVIPSLKRPGMLWSLSDSDGPARIFATDTTGVHLGSIALRGARNVDWEAISAGPCRSGECLYVADTGDNLERRASVDIYRLPEPPLRTKSGRSPAVPRPERLELRYPDGPRDVEAMFVDGKGDLHLISKGRTNGFRHYRVPAAAWERGSAVAELVGLLPIDRGGGLGRFVTDAAIAPDGNLVAVRTYQEIFLFRLTRKGSLAPTGMACGVAGLEVQGEGVAWLDEETLVLTSEGVLGTPGTVSLGRCPGP